MPLHRVLDLTTTLLRRMKCLRRSLSTEGENAYASFELTVDDVFSDQFYANLEHLLRCLQQVALDAIVCLCLNLLVADLFRWSHHQRDADAWFAEWPNAQHPLNTTWPWNVKTALLVLWGVCWMFYAHGRAGPPFNNYGQDFRAQPNQQQSAPTTQPRKICSLCTKLGARTNLEPCSHNYRLGQPSSVSESYVAAPGASRHTSAERESHPHTQSHDGTNHFLQAILLTHIKQRRLHIRLVPQPIHI